MDYTIKQQQRPEGRCWFAQGMILLKGARYCTEERIHICAWCRELMKSALVSIIENRNRTDTHLCKSLCQGEHDLFSSVGGVVRNALHIDTGHTASIELLYVGERSIDY